MEGIAGMAVVLFQEKMLQKWTEVGAYMSRHIAKNVVANKLASRCELQISYGIGIEEPISLYINTFGTNNIPEEDILKRIKSKFNLTPNGIIKYLDLNKPIYANTTNYGHFGKEKLSWERIIDL